VKKKFEREPNERAKKRKREKAKLLAVVLVPSKIHNKFKRISQASPAFTIPSSPQPLILSIQEPRKFQTRERAEISAS